jgi:hypothetical protein
MVLEYRNDVIGKRVTMTTTPELRAGHVYTVRLTVKMFGTDRIWITDDTDAARVVADSAGPSP